MLVRSHPSPGPAEEDTSALEGRGIAKGQGLGLEHRPACALATASAEGLHLPGSSSPSYRQMFSQEGAGSSQSRRAL